MSPKVCPVLPAPGVAGTRLVVGAEGSRRPSSLLVKLELLMLQPGASASGSVKQSAEILIRGTRQVSSPMSL